MKPDDLKKLKQEFEREGGELDVVWVCNSMKGYFSSWCGESSLSDKPERAVEQVREKIRAKRLRLDRKVLEELV